MRRLLSFLLALLLVVNPLLPIAGESWTGFAEPESALAVSPTDGALASMILGSEGTLQFKVENTGSAHLFNLSLRVAIGNGLLPKGNIKLEGVESEIIPMSEGETQWTTDLFFLDLKDLAAGESYTVDIPVESMLHRMEKSGGVWTQGQDLIAFGDRVPVTVEWLAGRNPQAVPGNQGADIESKESSINVELAPVEVTFSGGGNLLKGAGASYDAADNEFSKPFQITLKNNEAVASAVSLQLAIPDGVELSNFSESPAGYVQPEAGATTMNLLQADGSARLDFGTQRLAPGEIKTISFQSAIFNRYMKDGKVNAGEMISHNDRLPFELDWQLVEPDLDPEDPILPSFVLRKHLIAKELIISESVASGDDPIGYGSQLDYRVLVKSNQYYGIRDIAIQSLLEGLRNGEQIGQSILQDSLSITGSGYTGVAQAWLKGETESESEVNPTGIIWRLEQAHTAQYLLDGVTNLQEARASIGSRTTDFANNDSALQVLQGLLETEADKIPADLQAARLLASQLHADLAAVKSGAAAEANDPICELIVEIEDWQVKLQAAEEAVGLLQATEVGLDHHTSASAAASSAAVAYQAALDLPQEPIDSFERAVGQALQAWQAAKSVKTAWHSQLEAVQAAQSDVSTYLSDRKAAAWILELDRIKGLDPAQSEAYEIIQAKAAMEEAAETGRNDWIGPWDGATLAAVSENQASEASIQANLENLQETIEGDFQRTGYGLEKSAVLQLDFSTIVLENWKMPLDWSDIAPILAGDRFSNQAVLYMTTGQGIVRNPDSRADAALKIPLGEIGEFIVDINDDEAFETVEGKAVIQVGDVVTMHMGYSGGHIHAKQKLKEMFFVLPEGTRYVPGTLQAEAVSGGPAPNLAYQPEANAFVMTDSPVLVDEYSRIDYVYDLVVEDLPVIVEGKEDFHLSKLILETHGNVQSDRDESQFYYSAPKFLIDKEASATDLANLKGGQRIPFTITLENESRSAAYGITVQDQLPSQLIVNTDSFTINGEAAEAHVSETGLITFTVDSVPGATEAGNGQVIFAYEASVVNPAPAELVFENRARLISYHKQDGLEAPVYTDQPVEDTVSMTVAPFTVEKNVVDSTYRTEENQAILDKVRPGDTVTYEIEIQMEPGISVYDLTLKDTLPLGMDAQRFERWNGESWDEITNAQQADESNRQVYAIVIGDQGSATQPVVFGYRVTGTYRIAESYSKNQNKTNTAYVEWKTEPQGQVAKSKSAAATQKVIIPDVRSISFQANRTVKTVSKKRYVTYDPTIVDAVEFTARFKNNGNDTAYRTAVAIDIPAEYELVLSSIPAGLTYNEASRQLTGTIDSLQAGSIKAYPFIVQSNPGAVTAGSNRELKASMIEFYNVHDKLYNRMKKNSIYLNQAPTAKDNRVSGVEDQVLTGVLDRGDLNGDQLTYSVETDLPDTVGDFVFTSGNNWRFTPAKDYNGDNNQVLVKVTDAYGGMDTATIVIDIQDVNDAPVVKDQSFETDEETNISNQAITYSDVDSTAWSFELVGQGPSHGILTLRSDGSFDYHPPKDFYGEVTFSVRVTDNGDGDDPTILQDEASITIVVKNVQDAPVLTGDEKETNEDTPVNGTVSAVDPDGEDKLTYTIESQPDHGSATIVKDNNGQATYTYRPNRDYHGPDEFQVRVSDGKGNSDLADVKITVLPVNDPPIVEDQSFETKEDISITKGLTATDVDSDNLKFTIKQNLGENEGSLILREDGSFDFTPEKDFHGRVQFQVTVSDQEDPALTDDATITIHVTPVNDPPVASDLWITIDEDTATDGAVSASDVDGDSLTYELEASSLLGLRGTVQKTGADTEPTFSYTPKADDYGTESFVMIVRDGKGGETTATVTIQVTAVNDLPVTPSQRHSMKEDGGEIEGALVVSDADPTDILTSSLSREPMHGSAKVATSGAWTYEPDANWFGTETFDIRTDDGQEGSAVATITIEVESVNDEPTTVNYQHTTRQNLPVEGQVVAKDIDCWNHLFNEDSDQLSYRIQANGKKGHAAIDLSTGRWTYEPDHNYVGQDRFSILIQDGHGGSAVSEITILVIGQDGSIYPSDNQPPITGNQTILLTEGERGQTVYGQVIGTDPNGDQLVYGMLETDDPTLILEGIGRFRLINEESGQWELDVDSQADFANLPTFVSVKISDQRGGEAVARVYFAKEKLAHAMNGSVRDIESFGNEPMPDQLISGAKVTLYDAAGQPIGQTTSALDGSFDFGQQPAGIYRLEIEKAGFAKKSHEFVFEGSGQEVIYLSPYGLTLEATPKTLVMDGISISDLLARVTDLQGMPVADWTVRFESVVKDGLVYGSYLDGDSGQTDAAGHAVTRFQSADMNSLESQIVPMRVEARTQGRLKAYDQILLVFEPSVIEGIVIDQETGEAIAGALVVIEEDLDGDGRPDYHAEQITGADGRYSIPIPLGNSRYSLSITKPMKVGDGTRPFTFKQIVDVGEITGSGDRFYADRTVSGILLERSPDGDEQIPSELSRYALEVFDEDGRIHDRVFAVLNSDGTFAINGVDPGERYRIKPRIVFQGQTLYLPGIDVEVDEAGEIMIAEVLVDPFGTVTDESSGERIEGAQVTLYYADTARNRSAGRPIDEPVVLPPHPLALSNNENPQFSTLQGKYGYMVYPFTDYYLLAEKDGYLDFDSREDGIISVEDQIVIYDIEMRRRGNGFIHHEGSLDLELRAVTKTPRVIAGDQAEIELTAINYSDEVVSQVAIRSELLQGISPIIAPYTEGMRIRILGDELVITLFNVQPGESIQIPLRYRTKSDEVNGRVVRMEYGIRPLYGIKDTDKLNAQAGFLIIRPGEKGHHDRYLYGYPDLTVQPERAVSRAEAVAMVVRILKLEGGPALTTVFDKELAGHWARNNIAVAVHHGLIEGYLTGWFKPDQAMTRAEFATLVARTIDLDRSGDAKAFWAENTMKRLMDYGLLKGDPDGSLRPDDPITRAEAVTILNRLLMRGPLKGIQPYYTDLFEDHWAYGDLVEATYNHNFRFSDEGEEADEHDLKKPIQE